MICYLCVYMCVCVCAHTCVCVNRFQRLLREIGRLVEGLEGKKNSGLDLANSLEKPLADLARLLSLRVCVIREEEEGERERERGEREGTKSPSSEKHMLVSIFPESELRSFLLGEKRSG